MRIDAHHHFWRLDRGDYGWLTPDLAPVYRDFGPEDLAPLLEAEGIGGTVLVQAAPTEAETYYMLELAERADFVRGVVGWTDFEAAEAPEKIADFAKNPRIKGFRPMIQDIEDPDWILRPGLAPAFAALEARDLTFDALVLPQHLPRLLKRLDRHPGLRCVIDHAAKPDIAGGDLGQWRSDMARLAHETSAWCKLSGLVTEARSDWSIADLRPVAEHLLDTFGPERLIWGSDWPVCRLAADYADWAAATESLLSGLSATERNMVMGGNAARAYRLAD